MKAKVWSSFQLDPQSKVEWSLQFKGKYKEAIQFAKEKSINSYAVYTVYPEKRDSKKHPIVSFYKGKEY